MKKSIQILSYSLAVLLLISCNSNNEIKIESIENNSSDMHETNNKIMTVAEAKQFLESDANNDGTEIAVQAFNWGIGSRKDGVYILHLGDEKIEDCEEVSFTCILQKEDADSMNAIENDSKITVLGKITKSKAGYALKDCEIF